MLKPILTILLLYLILQYLFTLHFYKKGKKLAQIQYKGTFKKENNKKSLNIYLTGDSVASGVGATSEKQTIAYRLSETLSKNHSVTITNKAENGNTVKDILNQQPPNKNEYGIIILIISSNDVFKFTNLKEFKQQTKQLFQAYSKLTKRLIILGPLRVDTCTAIPFFLRIIYYFRGKKYLKIFEQESKHYKNIKHYSSFYIKDKSQYGNVEGSDRFHPSDEGYRMYSDILLRLINK